MAENRVYFKSWYDGPRGTCYKHHDTLADAKAPHPKYGVLPARVDRIEIIYLRPEEENRG